MIDFAKLREPFHPGEIEWRIGRAGKNDKGIWATAFAYVTNRAIMQRLDEVCGPENWRNEFSVPPNAAPASAALCTIYIKVDGEWVGKSDGADNSDMESTKGGLSDSMKRAAVQWGIGRYLYDLEEGWVEVQDKKGGEARYQPANEKKGMPAFYWIPPRLPEWALPEKKAKARQKPDTVEALKDQGKLTTADKLRADQQAYVDSWANYLLGITPDNYDDYLKNIKSSLADKKLKPAAVEPIVKRTAELAETAGQFDMLDKLMVPLRDAIKADDVAWTKLAIEIDKVRESKLETAAA